MGDLDGAVTSLIVAVAVITASVCAFLFWLVPIVWRWIKPIIHAVTG